MPLVTSYTMSSLEAFIETELESVAEDLGMLAGDAITATARLVTRTLGHTDIAEATDMLKVETIATWLAWRRAKGAATALSRLKAGSVELYRSEMFDHINDMLRDAEAAALRYDEAAAFLGTTGTAYVSSLGVIGNPYPFPAWSEWG